MNVKNIFRIAGSLAASALLLIPAAGFVACNDDDTEGGAPYFRLENKVVSSTAVTASSELGFEADAVIGDATLELICYDIRSNCDWQVECNATDGDWIQIHPLTGRGDGKVRFCLEDNESTAPRSATVVFRYADGRQTEATLMVSQAANVPYIRFTVNNVTTSEVTAGRYAAHYDIRVASNVEPFYEPDKSRLGDLHRDGQRHLHARPRGLSRGPDCPGTPLCGRFPRQRRLPGRHGRPLGVADHRPRHHAYER